VAEATVHALAAVEVPAEVPAAVEVQAEVPATSSEGSTVTSMEAALLSCHKTSEGKSQRWQGIHPFLPFSVLLSLAYSIG
jgi:hypothetical protein